MSDPGKAVFLSYASQDAEAAKRIADALRAAGVEVWFDQSELVGGDAWDAKIRGHIKTCTLFVPIISANTNARREGYFRREWKLAVDRTHDMDEALPFLVPVVIDDTTDAGAFVPEKFREVQWTRLPGGGTSPAFCQRVKKLLSGDTEVRSVPPQSSEPVAARRKSSHWFTAGIVILSLLTGLIFAWWVLSGGRRASLKPSPPGSPSVSAATPVPLSEARQLAEQARAIVDARGSQGRSALDTAAELCTRAQALDPADAEVWAATAYVDTQLYALRYDASEERRQQAQRAAAKAIALAPGSRSARLAQAEVFARVVATPEILTEAEKIYRELLRGTPDDFAATRGLAEALRGQGRVDEAVTLYEKAGDLAQAGWTYFSCGRYAEAGKVADRLLARERSYEALYLKAHVELFGFEDPEAAQKTFNEFPPKELLTEDGASVGLLVGLYRRDPDLILRVLSAFPSDFLDKQGFAGPKRIWTGAAHEMAGRPEVAAAEWTVGLQQVVERRKDKPNDANLLMAEASLRAYLGQREEAERVYRLYFNLSGLGASKRLHAICLWIILRLGKPEEALAGMTAELQAKHANWRIMHANLRYLPLFDALRGDPRFEKLLRDTLPPGAKPFDDAKPEVKK